MTRALTAGVVTETEAAAARAALFVKLAFDGGTVFVWSGVGSITTSAMGTLPAATWIGTGTLGTVSAVEETTDLSAAGVTFALSGIDSTLLSIALGEHYQGRRAEMWLGFFDANWALIADPPKVFSGFMDTMVIEDGGATATIRVNAESRLVDLERAANPKFYTDQDQKALFAGDRGLEFVEKLQNAEIFWGRRPLGFKKKKTSGGGTTKPGEGGGGGRGPGGGRDPGGGDKSSRGARGE